MLDQVAGTPIHKLSPTELILALQLGNVYLLMAFVGIAVLYTTTDAKTVRNYLFALFLGDIGHLAVTYYILESERYFDVFNWNAMAWGNIGITVRFSKRALENSY